MTKRTPRVAVPAKISRPKPQRVLLRTRAFRAIDAARKLPLVWVVAPPGSGKTTLISHYLEKRRRKHVWYQVDADDADLGALFKNLTLAVTRTGSGRAPLPGYGPEYQGDIEAFCRLYFRAFFARLRAPTTLIFDDYQEVSENAAFHRAVLAAREQMPEGHQIIVASRTLPPPVFARLRAQRRVAFIDWQVLKLTRDEMRRLANLQRNRAQPAAQERLQQQCEGWITGFLLLREQAIQSHGRPLGHGRELPSLIRDYFEQDVFACAPHRLRQLWLSTACLPKFTKKTAVAVSAMQSAPALIETLASQNFFVRELDADPPIYQYHALLQAFLHEKLLDTHSPTERVQLMHRSAVALHAQGETEAAFELYCSATAWAEAVQLTLSCAPIHLGQGRWQTLQRWIGSLPQAVVSANAWLLYWRAVCVTQMDPLNSLSAIERAYEGFLATDDAAGQALCASAVMVAHFSQWGNFEQRDRWSRILERLLSADIAFPTPAEALRAWSALLLAYSFENAIDGFAAVATKRVLQLCRSSLPVAERLGGATNLLFYLNQVAGLPAASEVVQEFSPLATSAGLSPLQRAGWLATKASHVFYAAQVAESLELQQRAHELLLEARLMPAVAMSELLCIWLALADNRLDIARAQLESVAGRIDRTRANEAALYDFVWALLSLLEGRPQSALSHVEKTIAFARSSAPASRVSVLSLYSLLLADEGRMQEAQTTIAEAVRASAGARSIVRFTALLFNAEIVRRSSNDPGELQSALSDAFAMGQRSGLQNSLVWIAPMMSRLCAAALAAGIEVDHVERLISKHRLLPPDGDAEVWPWPVRIYTLGRFDIVVEGRRLKFSGKAQRRPLDVLRLLIALGGRKVATERLTAELWPHADGDAAYRAFKVSLHRLRRLLGSEAVLRMENGEVTLDAQRVWVDVWTFARRCGDIAAQNKGPALSDDVASKTLALYQGAFLGAVSETWALAPRERLRGKYLRALNTLGEARQRRGDWQSAAGEYERGIDVEPTAEEIYVRLIRCYQQLGRLPEALAVYRRCETVLRSLLNVSPTRMLRALYEELRESI
jgi:LuxR family maltose regulon positive regulatory protein